MVASTVLGIVEIIVGILVAGGIVGGFYHKFVVQPAREDAEEAMHKAKKAHRVAGENEERIGNLESDLRENLQDLSESVSELVEGMERQRRESRGRSYQLYVLAKAINESNEAPDVPVPDEDDFLRGGGGDGGVRGDGYGASGGREGGD